MALKGIEAQLMITRAADYTKDTSVMQRKNELMSDYLAVQQKTVEAQEKQRVLRTLESEDVYVRPDDDGGGGAAGGGGGKRSKKNAADGGEQVKPGTMVMSEERIIDIKI